MPDNLAEWLIYLEAQHPKSIALGLDRVTQIKQRLNLNPNFPIITVGGTNGKGSVCAMLESMLHAAGYKVGCYTSPHLLYYNERVRIDKRQASDAELCASFAKIEQARKPESLDSQLHNNEVDLEIPLTYFEFGTLAALQCFIAHEVEVAILEVGLGGRLDAVNVFDSDCAVVTNVNIDHTDYLGDTRDKIAFEKAGIYRKHKVAICADENIPQSLTNHAQQIDAALWRIGSDFSYTKHQDQWDFKGKTSSRSSLPYPELRGEFQLNNACAVLAALDALKDKLPVSMGAVRRGLTEVTLAGRFQFVPGRPQLILDVAHNPHAAKSLAQNLAVLPPCNHSYAVFAMLSDKDIVGVVEALSPYVDTWLVAGLNVPRGAKVAELQQVLRQFEVGSEVLPFDTIEDAVTYAYNAAGENDRISAFGSFYTIAEVMQARDVSLN